MRQQQRQHDPKSIKDQLRERIQGHFSFPETITEGWEKEDALRAVTELLEEGNKPSSRWERYSDLLGFGGMLAGVLVVRFFGVRQGKVVDSFTWVFFMEMCFFYFLTTFLIRRRTRKKLPISPKLQSQVKLVQVLAALLVRVDEVRLVPQVLEAARRVPELPAGELRDAWWQVQEETLGRLLPRMTTGEAQALTEEQRAYLRHCLSRQLPEATVVAILLTLGSAGDQEVLSFAQHFLGQPFPRVQVAAQECLVALRQGATKP